MISTASFTNQPASTDLSLADRVRICIHRMGYPQLKTVDCQCEGDEILLKGQIDSFYMKQVAQEVATKTPGVRAVHNEIEVC